MNNKLGISTACFYPDTTENSLDAVINAGIKCCELFVNSPSELDKEFIDDIIKKQNDNQLDIVSVHPFMSFAESFFLFSDYERRFRDILPFYIRFFEAMQRMNSEYFVIHGAKYTTTISDEQYFERFAKLIEEGKKYNVSVCQENVVRYKSENPEFLKNMRAYLGNDFKLVLDIKQSRRTLLTPYDFTDTFADNIVHIHISDYSGTNDCIPPFEGLFDFEEFFRKLKSINYGGALIIELYKHSYKNTEQIFSSFKNTENLLISV